MDSSLTCTNQPLISISMLLDPVTHAEKQVEAALDDLVATGALQNCMNIESLLNPVMVQLD